MQTLLNGLVSGAAIALLAVGFQCVYVPTRVFFLGLAGVYSLAPFVARTLLTHGFGWYVAGAAAVLACVTISVLCEWLNHAPLTRRRASTGSHLIASLGTYILISQVVALVWGNETQTLRTGLDSATRIGNVVITGAQSKTLGLTAVLLAALALFLMRSDLGLRLRALADNPTQFALLGYDVGGHRLAAFAVAGVFAAAASLVISYDVGFDARAGLHAVLLAIVAVIIGGERSFGGPVVGAVALGILRSQIVWYGSARWEEAATFGLLAVFLLVRPGGLVDQRKRLEAAT